MGSGSDRSKVYRHEVLDTDMVMVAVMFRYEAVDAGMVMVAALTSGW